MSSQALFWKIFRIKKMLVTTPNVKLGVVKMNFEKPSVVV